MSENDQTRRGFFERLACGSYALLLRSADHPRRPVIEYRKRAYCIEVYRQGRRIQQVASANPSFLALDHGRNFLYAVNEIDEYEGLPAGSVESYALASGAGRIELISRQPLSLSAIRPKRLALSPDGGSMVVAVYGGGAYNVLPIDDGGRIGPVRQILKEIGSGPHPKKQATAHPHSVVFHPGGRFVITTDFGTDRINVFSFEGGRLNRVQQLAAAPGSGPGDVSLERGGQFVFVEHLLRPLRSCYRFNERTGRLCVHG